MSSRGRLLLVCAAVLLVSLLLAPFVGNPLPTADAFRALFAGPGDSRAQLVVWDIRMPRIALALLVGASAAVAGSTTQALTRNVLGTPSVLGLNLGAALALVSAQVAGVALAGPTRVLVAFAGATLAALLVLAVTVSVRGGDAGVRLALAGACVGLSADAVLIVFARLYDLRQDLVLLHVGGLGHATWLDVFRLVGPVCVGVAACSALAPRLAVGLLPNDAAVSLGASTQRSMLLAGGAVLLLQGAVVAAVGPIAFVDLLVPLAMRARLGPDPRTLLVPSALGGAALVLFADGLARGLSGASEVPTGLFTAAIGLPAFFWLVTQEPR